MTIQTRRWLPGGLALSALLAAGCGGDAAATDAGPSGDGAAPTDALTAMDAAPKDAGPTADASPTQDAPAPGDAPAPTDAGCTGDGACPAGQVCTAGACVAGCNAARPCPGAQACCAGACVDAQTSLAHCGACGAACAVASGTAACVAGRCTVTNCPAGTASCDDAAANGCETDTRTAAAHCGGCGMACPSRPNAPASCAAGACGVVCSDSYANCDGAADNGCEVDTRVTVAHCGACNRACAFANAVANCAASACALGACNAGFGDCDATAATGCETDTRTSVAHCGGCGTPCATPNATPSCAAGACAVGTCNEAFGNCDAMAANGCEVDLRTSVTHCGACGRACGAGQTCAAGACQYGNGSDGPLTVTADQTINVVRAGAAGAAGSTSVALTSVVGAFAAGQSVLLHQTQSPVGSVGHYEYARVASVAGATLTLAAPLRNAYTTDATSRAQVVRVQEYTTVTVNAGTTLSAPAWDRSSGGILAFDATARVSAAGAIDVTGRGFRGNRRTCAMAPAYRCMRGVSGEGHRGVGAANILPNQSGGGGGGAGQDCAAGGGGGHATPGEQGSAGSAGGRCAEGNPIPPGGAGGTAGVASLSTVALFGGAGGEGGADEDGSFPGGGGHGGGVVLVRASSVVLTGAGSVRANGGDGENGHQTDCPGGIGAGMGGGGGGAGGAVRITALVSATVLQAVMGPSPGVRARGGGGGYCGATSADYAAGEGGNGRVSIASPMVVGATFPAHTVD